MPDKIIVLDFGSQYNQLIARRVRECNVYSEVVPFDISIDKIKEKNPKGIIFTGGPASVYGEDSPKCNKEILNKKEKMVLIMFSIGRLTRSYELMQDFIKNTNISVISINDGFIIKK